MESDSHWDLGWRLDWGSVSAQQESELALGSVPVLDSGFQSVSASALESEAQLDSDLAAVSELASDFPPAPDSVTCSVPQPD